MTLEALSSNGLLNFLLSETLSPTPFKSLVDLEPSPENDVITSNNTIQAISPQEPPLQPTPPPANRGKKRRRRKPKVCKNEEEAESQRMTHIAVERNRRRQMNQHLSVLRSLMPLPFAQKGDQASIVGGAIDFIKELEHELQSLEAQKLQKAKLNLAVTSSTSQESNSEPENSHQPSSISLSQFFLHSYDQGQENRNGSTSSVKTEMEELEVTLIETHANIRILSRRRGSRWNTTVATGRPPLLSKLVAGLQSLSLSVLHLSVTTSDTFAIYSINTKVEESCRLSSVDDIAGAVSHMLISITEEEPFGSSSIPQLPFDFLLNHTNATQSF